MSKLSTENKQKSTSCGINRPMPEVMEEIRNNLRLIDGETKSYYENSYRSLCEGHKKIAALRLQNEQLRAKLSTKRTLEDPLMDNLLNTKMDCHLLNSTMSPEDLRQSFDEEVAKEMNKLNLLRHETRKKERILENLLTDLNEVNILYDRFINGPAALQQAVRVVENKIEKVKLKQAETRRIHQVYCIIKDKMNEESITYPVTLDALAIEIERCAQKIEELRPVYKDAIQIRDKTKAELQRHEELVYAHRKRRELEAISMRQMAEPKKEKLNTKRGYMMDQELKKLEADALGEDGEENSSWESQPRLAHCTSIYNELKKITGYSELADIIKRFQDQDITNTHLKMKHEQNDAMLKQLRLDTQKLKQELQELRVNYDNKMDWQKNFENEKQKATSDWSRKIDDLRIQIQAAEQQLVMAQVFGEHLLNKLQLVHSAPKRDRVKASLSPRERIVDSKLGEILEKCMELEQQLINDLDDYDIQDEECKFDEAMKATLRTHEEFQTSVEKRVPTFATRVEVPGQDSESADELEIQERGPPTREEMKRRSKMVVDGAKRKMKQNARTKYMEPGAATSH